MSFLFKIKRLIAIASNKAFAWAAPQEGEAILLKKIFTTKKIKEGFYDDIGAHHPFRYSNTYIFYQIGWRGINIEPNKKVMKEKSFMSCYTIVEEENKQKYLPNHHESFFPS